MGISIEDDILVAFLDGELSSGEHARVVEAVAADALLALRLDRLTRSVVLFKAPLDEVLREPVPERLLAAVMAEHRPEPATLESTGATVVPFARRFERWRPSRRLVGYAAAAALAGIIFGGSAEYMIADPTGQSGSLDNVAGYHNLLMATAHAGENTVFDMPVGDEKELPQGFHIPNMKPWELDYRGARKMVIEGKPALQYFFHSDKSQPGAVTLSVWPSTRADMRPTFERRANVNMMHWRQGGHAYALAGHADKGYMANMAQDIAWQLANG